MNNLYIEPFSQPTNKSILNYTIVLLLLLIFSLKIESFSRENRQNIQNRLFDASTDEGKKYKLNDQTKLRNCWVPMEKLESFFL